MMSWGISNRALLALAGEVLCEHQRISIRVVEGRRANHAVDSDGFAIKFHTGCFQVLPRGGNVQNPENRYGVARGWFSLFTQAQGHAISFRS